MRCRPSAPATGAAEHAAVRVNVAVPQEFGRTVGTVFGADGRRWLADLSAIADAVLRDWELDLIGCFDLSLNWVADVRCADGSPAVLKLGVPQAGHLADEAATLEFFAGRGAVHLLDRDDGRGALLLERARPGTPLSALVPAGDEEATAAFIGRVRRLHRPASPDVALPELTARGEAFAAVQGSGLLPEHLVHRAGRVFAELCASATERVVLHGDLHHDNILAADREPWLAIDPHGVVGDPGYEVGAFLYNPHPSRRDDDLLNLLPARVEQLADGLGMPGDRVIAWGFVQAVLSEVWTAQGGGAPGSRALDVARRLLPLLG